ncbi:MAG: MarR family transcriptional regulator [Rudanella sp.]|nr:MarR family transcriptional regulator [Rudanella sp.]
MTPETDKLIFDLNHFDEIRRRSLGRLSWRLKRYIENFLEPHLQERGFADFKLSYLAVLANVEERGITNNELARRAYVTKQMMSKTVSLLEQQGYIYTKKHESDSRSSVIFLNERGKVLFINLHECITEMHDKFSMILGQNRFEQLIDSWVDLMDGLDDEATQP